MAAWLGANIGTIIITLVLAGIVFLIIRGIIIDKKNGKSSCGGNCAHCHANCGHAAGAAGKK